MSSNLAYSLPARSPRQTPAERPFPRRIQAIGTRAQQIARPRIGYAIVVTLVIFAIFLAQLLLSIALSGGAYQITKLQQNQRDLSRVASSLGEQLHTLGSTQNLSANAHALGMVGDSSPAFLSVTTGRVVGAAAVPAAGSPSGSHRANGAGGAVPNSLLTDVPLVNPTSGHGDSNATNSSSDNSQSSAGPSTPVDSSGTANGDLPSPQTH